MHCGHRNFPTSIVKKTVQLKQVLNTSKEWWQKFAEGLAPSSVGNPPPPLIFFPHHPFLATFFNEIAPNEIRDKNTNKLTRETYLFMFRRLQNNIKDAIKAYFY